MKLKLCLWLGVLMLCLVEGTYAQTKMSAREAAIKIADRIVNSTTYDFVNKKTGEKYTSVKDVPLNMNIKVNCKYNNWHYTNGVTNIALLKLADKVKDRRYEDYLH